MQWQGMWKGCRSLCGMRSRITGGCYLVGTACLPCSTSRVPLLCASCWGNGRKGLCCRWTLLPATMLRTSRRHKCGSRNFRTVGAAWLWNSARSLHGMSCVQRGGGAQCARPRGLTRLCGPASQWVRTRTASASCRHFSSHRRRGRHLSLGTGCLAGRCRSRRTWLWS